jgi:penicillin-binding protein 1A
LLYLTVENSTGQIRAIIGGSQFDYNNQYNRALQAVVSPGSAINLYLYLLEYPLIKYLLGHILLMDQRHFMQMGTDPYTPNNYGGRWRGDILLRDALALSLNIPAIEVLTGNWF